jgi:CheY-like chemotaxis protein
MNDDLERRMRELERTNKAKDELLSVLSHELRAPLHAILGWSEVLLARNGVSSDDRRALEAIGRNARIQAQVIEDALELNRLRSGKLKLDPRALDLAEVVDAALDVARPLARAADLQLGSTVDPGATAIGCDADPQRLQQMLNHLLAYAIRSTAVRGEVALIVRRADSTSAGAAGPAGLELAVEFDGVPPVAIASAAGSHGFDVGLALVKALAELHGGALRVERGRQHGAAFVIGLPPRAADAIRPAPAALRGTGPLTTLADVSLGGLKVLVIDDDGDARELVKTILMDAHANAVTAASADEGLAMLRQLKPDVIISDIGMSLRDGYQFMRLVRTMSSSDGGRTPALALTAHVQTEDRTRALLAGYQEHISKPVEARALIDAVHRLTSAHGSDLA